MGLFFKLFFGFWTIWILWYVTGGPLRDDASRPYIGLTEDGTLKSFGTSSLQR